jgi:hypothetical protein
MAILNSRHEHMQRLAPGIAKLQNPRFTAAVHLRSSVRPQGSIPSCKMCIRRFGACIGSNSWGKGSTARSSCSFSALGTWCTGHGGCRPAPYALGGMVEESIL